MKILTWNVNLYLNKSPKREYNILQYIFEHKVDILFLQECSDTIISRLENHGYTLYGKTLSHAGWCCVMAKITSVDSVCVNNSVGVSVTIDGKVLATCHLAPGGIQNRNFRLSQVRDFGQILDLLCGDFNDENLSISSLQKVTDHKTWFLRFFQEESLISKKYDHVYHSQKISVKNLVISAYTGLSDHVPLQFEI